MITTGSAKQKVLSQYITIYQSIAEFSLDKMWLEIIVKFNKKDPDSIIDDVNAKVIEKSWEYLEKNKLSLDKFQLATIVMEIFTWAVAECEEPYKVIVKETKGLLQDYLNKNKQKRDALNRVKKEIEELEKEEKLAIEESELRKKNIETIKNSTIETATVNVVEEEPGEQEEIVFPKKRWRKKKETPKPEIIEPIEQPKPKKKRWIKNVYEAAVDFTF